MRLRFIFASIAPVAEIFIFSEKDKLLVYILIFLISSKN